MTPSVRASGRGVVACAAMLVSMLGVLDQSRAEAAVIYVTTLVDKISTSGGCSLKEAIYSANFDAAVAIDGVAADGTDHFITTSCVAGSGDDTIVLPARATFVLKRTTDDAHNPAGPTATPIVFSPITIEANGSTLLWSSSAHARAFTVGAATVDVSPIGNVVSDLGRLTIRNAHIKGFSATGGNGA